MFAEVVSLEQILSFYQNSLINNFIAFYPRFACLGFSIDVLFLSPICPNYLKILYCDTCASSLFVASCEIQICWVSVESVLVELLWLCETVIVTLSAIICLTCTHDVFDYIDRRKCSGCILDLNHDYHACIGVVILIVRTLLCRCYSIVRDCLTSDAHVLKY